MSGLKPRCFRPTELPEYECREPPRRITPLIDAGLTGSETLTAGLYRLPPKVTGQNDIHTDDEMYYILSGKGRLVLGGESFVAESGMVVFIPADCPHQITNIGEEDFCLLFVFGSSHAETPKYLAENWIRHEPAEGEHSSNPQVRESS